MLIYGTGGHAAVVRSVLLAQKTGIVAAFDDDFNKEQFFDQPILSPYNSLLFASEKLIIAVGNNANRRAIAGKVKHAFGNAIHPSVLVNETFLIKCGTVIMHNAILQARVLAGMHCIINTGAIVEHDCNLGDFVHVAPGAILCGGVMVGAGSLIGAGSIVNPNLNIGKNCIIGAGSIVTRNVPDGATVYGNPARIKPAHYEIQNSAIAAAHEREGNELHSGSI